jgi:hypothetical protein
VIEASVFFRLQKRASFILTDLYLKPLDTEWEEMEVNWNRPSNGELWENEGGDFDDSKTIGTIYSEDVVPINTYVDLVIPIDTGVVQEWVNMPSSNMGFVIKAEDPEFIEEVDEYCVYLIRSSDQANIGERPMFSITYVP